MLDDALRARLESLNRGPLPDGDAASIVRAPRPQRQVSRNASTNSELHTARPLPGLLRRGELVKTAGGEHWVIRVPLDALWQNGTKLAAARHEFLQSQLVAAQRAIEPAVVMDVDFAALVAALPDRAILLDLETCGLAGAALFLIGLLRHIEGVPTVELLLARNFAEEVAVLESLWQIVAAHDVLVTFNGKTFDWPMILERTIRHRLQPAACGGGPQPVHVDVLHHARRRWRKRLPDCRLQTLERQVCRRHRGADIPGRAIPAVYAEYVRTGLERDMDAVLYHNALDLVTLFDLALRLAA